MERCAAQDLERPEAMYRKLGAKLVVGMPFKDQATSDTLLLAEVPPSSQPDQRRALARLQVLFLHPYPRKAILARFLGVHIINNATALSAGARPCAASRVVTQLWQHPVRLQLVAG